MAHCKVYLSSRARLKDVVDVLALLTWATKTKFPHGYDPDAYITDVYAGIELGGLSYTSSSTNVKWHLFGTMGKVVNKSYNFEYGHGFHGMDFAASDFGVALGKRLVDFFGGKVDFNGHDTVKCDYARPIRHDIGAEVSSPEWYQLQRRKFHLKAITQKELDEAYKVAYYSKLYNIKTNIKSLKENSYETVYL